MTFDLSFGTLALALCTRKNLSYPYKQQQNDFFCLFSIVMFISLTTIEKTSFTLIRLFADASMNGQPHISASACPIKWNENLINITMMINNSAQLYSPSSVETSLWHSKSSLLATRRIGAGWLPFTRLMTFLMVVMSWKVWWLVSEYITIKPWPFFM